MSQAAQKPLPFEPGWWSFDLGDYRECDGTYCFFEYDSLPPIDEAQFTGTLEWLGPLDENTAAVMAVHHEHNEGLGRLKGDVAKLAAQAEQLGLHLPEAFLRLMSSRELQNRIPSCTACYFSMSDEILPCPGVEDGYITRFLNDQQDVLLWYLYLTPQGDERVLVSPILLDEFAGPANAANLTDEWRKAILANTRVCGPSFEAFLYRFWLENTLWDKVNGDDEGLTDAEKRYLAHYKK
jgi:hypothetical protein